MWKTFVEKYVMPVLVALTLVIAAWISSQVSEAREAIKRHASAITTLTSYRTSQWPLEKQLMLIEHEQLRAQISVLEANIEELENEIEDLQ